MRCKQHFSDHSSSVGVCASCLRERLFLIVAAQAESHAALAADDYDCGRRSDPYPPQQPPPLAFPRSVSPYVSRRKSDDAPPWIGGGGGPDGDRRFFSTPQVGPAGSGSVSSVSWKKKRSGKFSLFGSIFRSRSDKPETDPRISSPSSSSSPNWWLSSVISGRRKKSSATSALGPLGDLPDTCRWPQRAATNRGMSPEYGEEYEAASPWASGYSPEVWRTPGTGRRRSGNPRNAATGMAFCLSPLVRASPGRQWNQKGMPPEMGYPGEIRTVAAGAAASNPHLSTASSLCANRSRKLVDFGRSGHNR